MEGPALPSRLVQLEEVRVHFPKLYLWDVTCYGQHSYLNFGDIRLTKEAEVQQGDPLGPFLFSLAINDLVNSCQSPLNLWYLDDGTVASDIETVLSDYQRILDAATNLGLTVNPNKCELCIINPQSVDTSLHSLGSVN